MLENMTVRKEKHNCEIEEKLCECEEIPKQGLHWF